LPLLIIIILTALPFSPLSTPLPAGCTALSTNITQPSGILCRWTNRLELVTRWAQRWDWEHFSPVAENTAF